MRLEVSPAVIMHAQAVYVVLSPGDTQAVAAQKEPKPSERVASPRSSLVAVNAQC